MSHHFKMDIQSCSASSSDTTNKLILIPYDTHKSECKNRILSFPYVKRTDNEFLLPQYTEVLLRSPQHGVKMEDLDLLQRDLEMLLSSCAIRQRLLLLEIEPTAINNAIRRNQGNKYRQKQLHLTNKLIHDTSTLTINQIHRSIHEQPVLVNEVPKVNRSRNLLAESFWSFTEPYFAKVTTNDLNYIDKLIKESMQDVFTQQNVYPTYSHTYPCLAHADTNLELKTKPHPATANSNENHDLALETERCLTELSNVRKNNLIALHKLRTGVRKKICLQQPKRVVSVREVNKPVCFKKP